MGYADRFKKYGIDAGSVQPSQPNAAQQQDTKDSDLLRFLGDIAPAAGTALGTGAGAIIGGLAGGGAGAIPGATIGSAVGGGLGTVASGMLGAAADEKTADFEGAELDKDTRRKELLGVLSSLRR